MSHSRPLPATAERPEGVALCPCSGPTTVLEQHGVSQIANCFHIPSQQLCWEWAKRTLFSFYKEEKGNSKRWAYQPQLDWSRAGPAHPDNDNSKPVPSACIPGSEVWKATGPAFLPSCCTVRQPALSVRPGFSVALAPRGRGSHAGPGSEQGTLCITRAAHSLQARPPILPAVSLERKDSEPNLLVS